jgi:hypothetical protein
LRAEAAHGVDACQRRLLTRWVPPVLPRVCRASRERRGPCCLAPLRLRRAGLRVCLLAVCASRGRSTGVPRHQLQPQTQLQSQSNPLPPASPTLPCRSTGSGSTGSCPTRAQEGEGWRQGGARRVGCGRPGWPRPPCTPPLRPPSHPQPPPPPAHPHPTPTPPPPASWILYGISAAQLSNVETPIVFAGTTSTVRGFLAANFDYHVRQFNRQGGEGAHTGPCRAGAGMRQRGAGRAAFQGGARRRRAWPGWSSGSHHPGAVC